MRPSFGVAFLKCIENAAFLFKNTYNEVKGPILFEIEIFCSVSLLSD